MNLESSANRIFDKSYIYLGDQERPRLKFLEDQSIVNVMEYSQTPEGRVAVSRRGRQLDIAIENFNTIRRELGFTGPHQKESAKLDEIILEKNERLPSLIELPDGEDEIHSYFKGFLKLMKHGYYTFLKEKTFFTPEELNILITGLIVDGYGFAVRGKRSIEKRHGHPNSDLTIVNAICEMIPPGEMQREMYKSNWYKPTYGLDSIFCEYIAKQYGA